jgi:hypothetical protein
MANQVVYGFHTVQQRFAEPVTALGETVVNDLITQAMAEHNRQMDAFTALFLRRGITDAQRTFSTPIVTRNQPLDEAGRPIPIRGAAQYSAGFPLQDSGNAIGRTWLEAQKLRVEQLNDLIAVIQDGDRSWVFDHILAALFNDADRTFFDPEKGQLTVKPLANGDAQVYQVKSGEFAGGTDNHLLGQANAIGAGADNVFATHYAELSEHPENGGAGSGRIISFIPTGLKSATTGLATFNPLPSADIRPGANADVLVGSLGINVPGTVLGMDDSGTWIVEWPRIPAGYVASIQTTGEPPIGERVDEFASLRGFIEMDSNEDFPWYQRNWMRRAGYGAWNRLGAVVSRIGNASYAVPTNYATVMP